MKAIIVISYPPVLITVLTSLRWSPMKRFPSGFAWHFPMNEGASSWVALPKWICPSPHATGASCMCRQVVTLGCCYWVHKSRTWKQAVPLESWDSHHMTNNPIQSFFLWNVNAEIYILIVHWKRFTLSWDQIDKNVHNKHNKLFCSRN